MSAPKVDVIGWFDDFIRNGPSGFEDEARAVQAAIAELIEAAAVVECGSGGCPCTSCLRLRAAIANIGGQP